MKTNTFILQYSEGTYISQINASDKQNAMREWLRNLDIKEHKGLTSKRKQLLIEEDFEDEEPILIQGCINVWCFGMRIGKELALINFIQTEKSYE